MSWRISAEELVQLVETDLQSQRKVVSSFGGPNGLAKKLMSHTEKGVSTNPSQLDERTEMYGTNGLPNPPSSGFFKLLLEQFKDATINILCISAFVSLLFGVALPEEGHEDSAWIEGAAIVIAIIIVTHVGAIQNTLQERKFRELDKKSAQDIPIKAIRDGRPVNIMWADVRVGDILKLKMGDKIPADGVFVDNDGANECRINTSSMTGESVAVLASTKRPIMLSGTHVETGKATMLVVATGLNSQWGILFQRLQRPSEPTPLQVKLETLAKGIGYLGAICAILIFLALLLFWLVDEITGTETITSCFKIPAGPSVSIVCTETDQDKVWDWGKVREIINFFIVAVTVVVVAIPEGLPLAVTLSLAFSMKKMTKDHCLVRRLASCETMGGATDICSDKTGTLTENRMTVVEGWLAGKDFNQLPLNFKLSPEVHQLVTEGISVNSDAHVFDPEEIIENRGVPDKRTCWQSFMYKVPLIGKDEDVDVNLPDFQGNKTECALVVMVQKMGENYRTQREEANQVKQIQFTSDRKRMSTIVHLEVSDDAESPYRMYTKGASELIVKRSVNYITETGKVKKMNKKIQQKLLKKIKSMASKGLRTIGLAYRDFESEDDFDDSDDIEGFDIEDNLTLIGLTGIEDPIRQGVPESVRTCQEAGITVRMVTGDYLLTAQKIALDCGIYDEAKGIAMEGPQFRAMSDEQIDDILDNLQVLARSVPLDKERLVERLKNAGKVVGATGDGTNDAPALKAANVGLSMGLSGTEIAKAASDIVILDDNFTSIVTAVKWGRCVYDNIRKFLQFQLTVNVSALLVVLISALSQKGTPLTPVQLLWVNLIMDTMAALALGTEKPTDELLTYKPYGTEDAIPIDSTMWVKILGQGIWQIIVLLLIVFIGADILGLEDESREHYTVVFNTFVWMQIFNELNARKVHSAWKESNGKISFDWRELNILDNIYRNYIFMAVIIITSFFQALLVEFGGNVVKTSGQSWQLWFIAVGFGATSLVVGVILALIPANIISPYVISFCKSLVAFLKEEIRCCCKGSNNKRKGTKSSPIVNSEYLDDSSEESDGEGGVPLEDFNSSHSTEDTSNPDGENTSDSDQDDSDSYHDDSEESETDSDTS